MADLRLPLKDECFELNVEIMIGPNNVIELLNTSFACPEELRGSPERTGKQLSHAIGTKLAEQGVAFSEETWSFDQLKVWYRPRTCAYGLIIVHVSVKARKL